MWGHTGNYPGYTQFFVASPDGRRSVTVSANTQLSPVQGAPGVFKALRRAEALAVCAALAGDEAKKHKVVGKKNYLPRPHAKDAHAYPGWVKIKAYR